MAKVYGSANKFIAKNKYKNFVLYFIVTMACVVGVVASFALALEMYGQGNYAIAFVMAVLCLAVLWWIARVFRYALDADPFSRGGEGEEVVYRELEQLPESYTVFRGPQLPGKKGDIDFVVVGPTGIFTVETKSHGGYIFYHGGKLNRGRRLLEKNFLKQSIRQALELREYFAKKYGMDMYVYSILVFSSPKARLAHGLGRVGGVNIMTRADLRSAIMRQRPFTYTVGREIIEMDLDRMCSESK